MSPHAQAIKDLKNAGYVFDRPGSKHDVYYNADLKVMITLKRHDFNDNDLKYIRKEIREASEKRES